MKNIFEIVEQNNIDDLKAYIKSGGNVNIQNEDGDTALTEVSEGNIEIVKLLIESGADVHLKNKWGYTALDYAKIYNHTKIIDLLGKEL
jgi:ankyrin repeat protein